MMDTGVMPAPTIETRVCNRCSVEKPVDSFQWRKDSRYRAGGCRRSTCVQCSGRHYRQRVAADQVRASARRAYMASYYRANPWKRKIKCYQHQDRARGCASLPMKAGCDLLLNGCCFYCGETEVRKLGLDRIHNSLGHSIDNVKVCCEICNNILSDLPFTVKEILGRGLREARERGFLSDYVLKTKRQKKTITEV